MKYYINPAELEALRLRLKRVMRLDGHCRGGRAYNVRSLYFDDAFNSAYYDKIDGVMARDKYRLRVYNHSDEVIFLERKRKLGDLVQKSSLRVTRRLAEQLISGDPRGLYRAEAPLLRDLYAAMRTGVMRPAVLVEYDRLAFTHPAETTRITFDTRLRSGLSATISFLRTRPWWPFTTARWRFSKSSSIRISPATSAPCFPALPASAVRSPNT